MIRIYAIVALCGLLALAYWRYTYVAEKLDNVTSALKTTIAVAEKQAVIQADQDVRNINLQALNNETETQLNELQRCIADKSCVPRVRIKTACPAVPSANSTAAGADEAPAGFADINEQDYFNLIRAQKEAVNQVIGLQREVLARSAHDYCQPKRLK